MSIYRKIKECKFTHNSFRPMKLDCEFIVSRPRHFFHSKNTLIKISFLPKYFIILKMSLYIANFSSLKHLILLKSKNVESVYKFRPFYDDLLSLKMS